MKHLLSIATTLLALSPIAAQAQVGVGTTTPDAKSALDIRAIDKGLLIPRLTEAQRLTITSPPQGLMVYQTDGTASGGSQTGFWYYTGTGGWVFIEPAVGGLTLPYSGTTSNSSTAFAVSNTGAGQALSGTAAGNGTAAVRGENTNPTSGSGTGILGLTVSGYGVRGTASGTNGYGVAGEATDSRGVSGTSASGSGLYGRSTSGLALQAQKAAGDLGRVAELTNTNTANDSTAAYISTAGDRPALRAVNTATSAQAAIRGVKQSPSTNGIGVEGVITSGASGNAAGIRGLDQSGSGGSSGVIGLTAGGYGVRGIATANGGYGVSGSATDSYGVIGGSQSGVGVYGSSNSSYGVSGATAGSSGSAAGVIGSSSATTGIGVLGSATIAVRGSSTGTNGLGVWGTATGSAGQGVFGQGSGGAVGIEGNSSGSGRAGLFTKSGTSSGAVVEIRQSGTTTDPALVVSGASQLQEVNTAATGTANLLPVAYGRISRTGTILGGTGNFTVVQSLPSYGVYVITISNLNAVDLTNAVCQVTCRYGVPGRPNAEFTATANGQNNGQVEVHVSALSTPFDLAEADFTFVVYRP